MTKYKLVDSFSIHAEEDANYIGVWKRLAQNPPIKFFAIPVHKLAAFYFWLKKGLTQAGKPEESFKQARKTKHRAAFLSDQRAVVMAGFLFDKAERSAGEFIRKKEDK